MAGSIDEMSIGFYGNARTGTSQDPKLEIRTTDAVTSKGKFSLSSGKVTLSGGKISF